MSRSPILLCTIMFLVAGRASGQAPGEIAGLLRKGDRTVEATRFLAASFPRELSAHLDDILEATAALKVIGDRRLVLAALLVADPDAVALQDFLFARITGHDGAERALAIAIAGLLPRPAPTIEPAIAKVLLSASDVASRLEAALALGRGGFRARAEQQRAEALSALEQAFADREEMVALAAATSWVTARPGAKRVADQLAIVHAGRGSKLVGALLACGLLRAEADRARLLDRVPDRQPSVGGNELIDDLARLLLDRRAGAAATFALAEVLRLTKEAPTLEALVPGAGAMKPAERVDLLLELAAAGLPLEDPIDWTTVDWDERALEACIRVRADRRVGRTAKADEGLAVVARFLGGEATKQLLEGKLAQEPPFEVAWRAFREAEKRGDYDLAALLPGPEPLAGVLRARFVGLGDQEPTIADPKLAGKFDPAREIWGLTLPLLAGRPGHPPTEKYRALAEHAAALDRMLFDAALAYGSTGETAIVATRQLAVTTLADAIARREPKLVEHRLTRAPGLRFRRLRERLYLGLDGAARRTVVARALTEGLEAAPALRDLLDDWAAYDDDAKLAALIGRSAGSPPKPEPRPVAAPSRKAALAPLLDRLRRMATEAGEDGDPARLALDAPCLREPGRDLDASARAALPFLREPGASDYRQFLLLWCLPDEAEGEADVAALRRRLLDEGGGPEATALAAYQIARLGVVEDEERIEAALASEYRDQPVAVLLGLLEGRRIPAALRPALLGAALDTSPILSVLAMDCLGRLETGDETGLQGVVTTNLAAPEVERRIAAARLLERLKALSVAEVLALGDQLEPDDLGSARLALALARLGRPDPRLRRKLELATCSPCAEKRVAARVALETLWSGESSPPETLLDWRTTTTVAGAGSFLAAVPTPPGPAQIERIVAAATECPLDSDQRSARLAVIEAVGRRFLARGLEPDRLLVPGPDDPQAERIRTLALELAAERRSSEED